MNISKAISFLDYNVPNPTEGLPEELFLYITIITPLINVDLLIKDENGRTLLSLRDERYTGIGWHVPGGHERKNNKNRGNKQYENCTDNRW